MVENVHLRPIVAPPRKEAIVTFSVSSFSLKLAAASLENVYTVPRAAVVGCKSASQSQQQLSIVYSFQLDQKKTY